MLISKMCVTLIFSYAGCDQLINFWQTGGRPAGSITAALFLKAFAEGCEPKDDQPATLKWAHIDIAGTMEATRPGPYQEKGLTGRPVR